MISKRQLWNAYNVIFPYGNWRYYIMYFSSLLVLGVFMFVVPAYMLWLNYGYFVQTDTFIAVMPTGIIKESDLGWQVVGYLIKYAENLWLLFAVYVQVSLVSDIIRLCYRVFKWV